jgi:uncharacterized protein YqhQ
MLTGITAFIVLFILISYGFTLAFFQLLQLVLAYHNGTPKIS